VTTRNIRFKEYVEQQKQKVGEHKEKRHRTLANETLDMVITRFLEYRTDVEKVAEVTVRGNKSKISLLLGDLLPKNKALTDVTLSQFLAYLEKNDGIENTLNKVKEFYQQETELGHNTIAGLINLCNPFFNRYLELPVKVKTMGKKATYKKRAKVSEIDQLLHHIDQKYRLKIQLTDDEKKKQLFRMKWAFERIIITTEKYTWARSIEICNITKQDIIEMRKTNTLRLRSRKRDKNPEVYQTPYVPDEYIKEWDIYERYRPVNQDTEKAIIRPDGTEMNTRSIRRVFQINREDLGLGDHLTSHNVRRSMHTLARSVINNKKIAQLQLGDISSKIADTHYNIPDPELIQYEMKRLYETGNLPGETPTPLEHENMEKRGDMAYA